MSRPQSEAVAPSAHDRFKERARAGTLRLYNTRTRSVEPFRPLEEGHVRIYVCGLTPSAEAHLGHARSFMFFDVVRRWLTFKGLRVTFVQNVTDIDDRSIAAAQREGVAWSDVVERYYASFKRSMTKLNVREPDQEPRATQYLTEIKAMIAELMERGYAYAAPDGVYFRVRAFERYGALSGRNTDELMIGARIAADEGKDDPLDFALWKFAKPGEPSWESPWGSGRPGWHIECSAMSRALLGEPFDIHGGGYDLIFPHHENEIAQSEALMPAPPMAEVWMHGGLLQFDGKKMSKSLGNFEPLYQLLERHDPQAIRFLFLQTGYRKPMNFTEASIGSAASGLRRLYDAYDDFRHALPNGNDANDALRAQLDEYISRFTGALDDDFNTSGAVAALFELASEAAALISGGLASETAAFFHEALGLIGISPAERKHDPKSLSLPTARERVIEDGAFVISSPTDVGAHLDAAALAVLHDQLVQLAPDAKSFESLDGEPLIESAIELRYRLKRDKNFALADRVRDALRQAGITITDTKGGASWTAGA